ncbi:uncharacterized protein METZ01_LOCUS139296 [marine metagenome]|uniref:Uncharacterized protein n=1 Tax=marine metagenome TaxID=408172 RepID=A0A381ZC62_9ZZZZ
MKAAPPSYSQTQRTYLATSNVYPWRISFSCGSNRVASEDVNNAFFDTANQHANIQIHSTQVEH